MKSDKVKNKWYIVFALLTLVGCHPVPEFDKPIHECAAPPDGRASAMCFAADSIVYIVSGRMPNGKYSKSMLLYDTRTDSWDEASLPITARVNGTVCVTAQGIFLGLGYKGSNINKAENYIRDWWRFDPPGGTWQQMADFPSDKTDAAVCWSDDQSIWVCSGFHGYTEDMWRYDIAADRWEQLSYQTPLRVMSAVAAKCENRYFYGTGYRRQSKTDWYEWFPEGRWEKRASVPGGRLNAACAATERAVWIIGGWHYGDSLTNGFHYEDILRYLPDNNQWSRCGTLPCGPTENGAACAIGRRLYFGLGETPDGQLHLHWYYLDE